MTKTKSEATNRPDDHPTTMALNNGQKTGWKLRSEIWVSHTSDFLKLWLIWYHIISYQIISYHTYIISNSIHVYVYMHIKSYWYSKSRWMNIIHMYICMILHVYKVKTCKIKIWRLHANPQKVSFWVKIGLGRWLVYHRHHHLPVVQGVVSNPPYKVAPPR